MIFVFCWPFGRGFAFGGGSPSPPPPPPAPPTITDPAIQQEAANERSRLRARQGRSATILTAGQMPAALQNPPVIQPTLLGGGR
jgi:hypothetical protein